jgi:diguanylate cyclase (GGDEF)-like protein
MTRQSAEQDPRELRALIAALREEAANNERLFRKSLERELEILKAEGLPQLFEVICGGLQHSYSLDAVTLLLWDPHHELRHLLLGDHVRLEEHPDVQLVDSVIGIAPQYVSLHRPWLGPYMGCDHQLLFRAPHELRSIALIPLWRQDKLHGSINFGSRDEQRFTRHLATDFLAHLGVIASFAIENAMNRARLLRSGLTDYLTGWHNRRYLQARMREELARAQRQDSSLVCLLIDLDHFKQINDRYGHLAGDLALREAAQRIDAQVRGSDAAARYGGDEFVVLVPGIDLERARLLAERIRLAVSVVPIEIAPGQVHDLTASIGVAVVAPSRGDSDLKVLGERLIAEADAALYRAKQQGRNRVETASV